MDDRNTRGGRPVTPSRSVSANAGRARILSRQSTTDWSWLIVSACLYTLAAPPYEWDFAGWIALTPFFLALIGKSPRSAFFYGLAYGVLFCLGLAHWVYFAVVSFFPLSAPLGLFCTLLSYLFFIASYVACAAAGVSLLTRNPASPLCWLGVPALWVSTEFARSTLFSGFSWELLGYTQYRRLGLIQISDLTGVYGVSFLLAFSGYVAAEVVLFLVSRLSPLTFSFSSSAARHRNFPWRACASLIGMLVLTLSYGAFHLQQPSQTTAPPLTIALVHLDTPNTERWQRSRRAQTLLRYLSTTREHLNGVQPDLIVWPEFALGFYLDKELALRAQLSRLTNSVQAPLLVGAPRMEESSHGARYYNSAYFLLPNGEIHDTYEKIRLLPFAEYRPLGVLPTWLPHNAEYPTEFTPGARSTIFPLSSASFGVTICYEVTYSSLARQLARGGARFLVNLSNETWLAQGGAAAPAQHFSMAVFRAVETRRPLARVAAFGVTGIIDPSGHIVQTSQEKEGVLIGTVIPRSEQTVYTRLGDWFAISCIVLAGVALIRAGRWRSH